MYQSWGNRFPYLFPPFCLIGQVLKKLRSDQIQMAILIAPIWPGQTWFPQLLDQCIDTPRSIPNQIDLLSNGEGRAHPLIENQTLQLGVFLVTGITSRAKAFQKTQQDWSSKPGGSARRWLTHRSGRNGGLGVIKNTLIPILPP